MTKTSETLFDNIADKYYSVTPAIPKQYIQLLRETFNITAHDTIIDLGCGSGDLALALTKYSSRVQGIDISKAMIAMAQEKDIQKQVSWIHTSVEDFDLGEEKYDLITTFDSFHLFPNQKELIQRCARALKPNGALCIGWVMYAFDPPLQIPLEETFAQYGVPWDDWGAWTCPTFPALVTAANAGFSSPQQKTIAVPARITTRDIRDYLFSVSKTASLSDTVKQKISQALWKKISEIYPSGESVGNNHYTIMYCKKR